MINSIKGLCKIVLNSNKRSLVNKFLFLYSIRVILFLGYFMISTFVISIISIISTILLIVFFPKLEIKGHTFQTFYFPASICSLILLIMESVDANNIISLLFSPNGMNPIKILILFISMSGLSVVLDEVGLFKFLANWVLKKTNNCQIAIFVILFVTTSILTVFTSNDVIILTFTPFIIFFCKNAKVNPIPYLVSEFCAANTLSMLLIIGNPTNIYIASCSNIDFFYYFKTMFLPTLIATIVEFIVLLLLFRKDLAKEINPSYEKVVIEDKRIMIVGIVCLLLSTVLLAISSHINLEMYLISAFFALVAFGFVFIYSLIRENKKVILYNSVKRLPFTLIPFLISMFIIVMSLNQYNINNKLRELLGNNVVFSYGFSSLLTCNLINNIPMSVFYTEVIKTIDVSLREKALFSTIIGSNIGAFVSPIGALAGIMWSSILKKYDINYSFLTFVKYGLIIGIPTALTAFFVLSLVL